MQNDNSMCRIAETIGKYISEEYYSSLINGYDQKHPTEQKSVFIPKESILETLDKFPNVSGIRFMYGQKEGAAPTSRTVVLMPCNDTSTDRHVPNLILTRNGYLTDTGDRLTLDQCWELFNRYVNRMCSLWPEEARKDMPRACFFGITTLKDLLNKPDCEGIRYHFGYNPETDLLPNRYQAVMEAVDKDRQSLHIFVEEGQHCPPVCRTGDCATPIIPVGWPFYGYHETYEQVPEGTLYEMFHYVSPTLFEVIQDKEIFQQHFSECFDLAKSGNLPEARQALRTQLENMMEKYL